MFIQDTYFYILDTLFPKKCFGCKKEGFYICEKCLSELPRSLYVDKDIFAVFSYKNPVMRRLLWNLKYNGKKEIAKELSPTMKDLLFGELSDLSIFENTKEIFFVPLPMSEKRKRERGANHALLLASALSEKTNIAVLDCLYKTKDTKRQALIKNRGKRLLNVKNSMDIKKDFSVKGKTIVLVDDIVTTGGTIKEARRVLERHGARKILSLVVAH